MRWIGRSSHRGLCYSIRCYRHAHTFLPDHAHGPLETVVVRLTDQGYFGHLFHIPYETICTHPGGAHIAFGDPFAEHTIMVFAELLPLPEDTFSSSPNPSTRNSGDFRPAVQSTLHHTVPKAQLPIPITDARIRLISDIEIGRAHV